MPLFTMQEIQAMLSLANRIPMSPAEQLFAKSFFERLVAFCTPPTPPKPEPEPGKEGSPEERKNDEESTS